MPMGPNYNQDLPYLPGKPIGDGFRYPYTVDPMARIAELEARIASLEAERAAAKTNDSTVEKKLQRRLMMILDLEEGTFEEHRFATGDILKALDPIPFSIDEYWLGAFDYTEGGDGYCEGCNCPRTLLFFSTEDE